MEREGAQRTSEEATLDLAHYRPKSRRQTQVTAVCDSLTLRPWTPSQSESAPALEAEFPTLVALIYEAVEFFVVGGEPVPCRMFGGTVSLTPATRCRSHPYPLT